MTESDTLSGPTWADHELAANLAEEAGRLLMDMRRRSGLEGKELASAGDRASHEHLLEAFARHRPDDVVISEEDDDSSGRPWPRPERQWIVDPLDGTREFGEGRPDFAVHVALVVGGVAVVGAVALPAEGITLSTGVRLGLPARQEGSPLRLLVSRTRPAREATALAELLGAELVPMGSAGVKATAVVRGAGDVYLHSGGQYEWDSAAPVAVAMAAGAHTSRLDGSPLRYGNRDAWLPDLLVCRPEALGPVMEGLSKIGAL